jgi:hypothetical protein
MATIRSKDGTLVAYSHSGTGPALIFVDGALCYRASGPGGPVAEPQRALYRLHGRSAGQRREREGEREG